MYVLYISKKSSLSSLLKFLLTIPMTDLALAADLTHCILGFKSSVKCTPVFLFYYLLNSSAVSRIIHHMVDCAKTVTNVHHFAFTGIEL